MKKDRRWRICSTTESNEASQKMLPKAIRVREKRDEETDLPNSQTEQHDERDESEVLHSGVGRFCKRTKKVMINFCTRAKRKRVELQVERREKRNETSNSPFVSLILASLLCR